MPRKTTTWLNSAGQPVPAQYVPARDKRATALVTRHVKAAQALSAKLADLRASVLSAVDAFVEWSAEQNGVKTAGGPKGNVDLTSFDGLANVEPGDHKENQNA